MNAAPVLLLIEDDRDHLDVTLRALRRAGIAADLRVVRDGLVSFTGVHDGFARLSSDLRLQHRRRVFCLPGRFWLGLGAGEALEIGQP